MDAKKVLAWTAIAVGLLLLVLIAAAIALFNSPGFHRYLQAKIVATASKAMGSEVELEKFDMHPKTLTADVYGLTIHGKEGPGEKPLLRIQKATVGLKIISILRRKVNLSELTVERPVLNLVVTQQGSNLPQPPPSNGKNSTNIFDLAIGHVLLTNGEIDIKDRTIPIAANLFGLRTEITFSQIENKYSGTLAYSNGTIAYPKLKPLAHSLEARFDLTPSELNLKPLVFRVGGSHVLFDANVHDYANTPVGQGRYQILLHSQDFNGLETAATSGDLTLSGNLSYHDVPQQPIVRNVSLRGSLSSNGFSIFSPQAHIKINRMGAQYQLADGNFKLEGLLVNLLGGTLGASGRVEHLDRTPQSRFHLKLADVSLEQVKSSLTTYSQQSMPANGRVQATADAVWVGTDASGLKATSHVLISGALIPPTKSRSQRFPLSADVGVNYDGRKNLISVPQAKIELPATSITAQGEIGGRSNLSIRAVSSNLHQLMMVASSFSRSSGGATGSPLANLQGTASLNATVQGTLNNPKIGAQLVASKLQINQGQFDSLELTLTASPSGISITRGSLHATPRGQLEFSGGVGLDHWSYLPREPIAASLVIRQMPLAMLDQIALESYPVIGNLDGNLELHGSELDPTGQGKLQITKARVKEEPIENITLQLSASGGVVHSQVTEGSNQLWLNFTPKNKAYEVKLDVPPQELSRLHAVVARNLPVKGQLSISANGQGTLDDPRLNASIKLAQLQIRETKVSEVKLDLALADHAARFALNSSGGPADLRGNGSVRLTPGYYTEASLDTSKFPLDPLLAMYLPSRPNGLKAETELHASIRGPLADRSKVEAHLTIPTFHTEYQALQLSSTSPIRIDYLNSVAVLHPSGFKGTGTTLEFEGRVPITGGNKMKVSAHGTIDLRLAQMLNPDLQTGGTVAVAVDAEGTVKNPGMHGEIKLQNASFATQAAPVGIENLNASIDVSDSGLQITNAIGQMGGGQIKFGGSVIYRPSLVANLSLSAKSVRFRYPEGTRTLFDSDLTLTGNSEASTLQGRILIDSLSFTSDFDLSSFMSQFTNTSAPPTGQSFTDRLKLAISVETSSQLSVGTAQLGIEGQAHLRILGTASDPVVVGRAEISSGDIFFMKRQYHLERGVINFVNPNKTQPVLNLLITTTINQYNLSITVSGPIEKLVTNYISDPPLPPVDVINLIARGQTTSEGVPQSFGASSVLAAGLGQVESTVGSNISKLTGISGLQIDPLIGGANSNPSARLGLQKRVSKNFVFTFSTDVTQPQNEIIQGEYQLNKRWSVSVVRNENGGFAVDGRYHTNF